MNAAVLALLAALVNQVLHEVTHGVAAVLVGARWRALNLFASDHSWPGAASESGEYVIAGAAASVNIVVGFVCVALFARPALVTRPLARLFVLYLGAFSLFTGFGYLLFDPLFYAPGADLGDWRRIVSMLGGGWEVRIPLIALGAAGVLFGFFWLAYSALKFDPRSNEPSHRSALALAVLMVPYLIVNTVFTVLSFGHPLGADGTVLTVLQYWLGNIGLFWGFFLAGYWLSVKAPPADPSPLPNEIDRRLVGLAALAFVATVAVLLPTTTFA